jgi:hypothetical protein
MSLLFALDFQKGSATPTSKKPVKPLRGYPLSGISRLTEFGRIPVTVMITLPGRTDGVLGRSRRDFGSV